MADFEIDKAQVQAAIDGALKDQKIELPEAARAKMIDSLSSSMEKAAIVGKEKIQEQVSKIDFSKMEDSFSKIKESAVNGFEGASEALKNFAGQAGISMEALKDLGIGAGKFAIEWKALQTFPAPDFSVFSTGIEDVSNMTDGLSKLNQVVPGIQEQFKKFGLDKFLEAQDTTAKLEQSFFKLKSETGTLDEYLNAVNSGATSFTAQFNAVNETITNVSSSTGKTYDQVSKLGMILGEGMPRAMEEFNNVNISATESISDVEAAIKIAAATGQNATVVAEYMKDNYQKFGNAAEGAGESSTRAAANFAKMSAVANEMNISFSKMESIVSSVGDAFLYYGDNTQSLVNIVGKLGPAFQAAKLSPEAITKLSQSMVKSLSDMGLAQRAFLSMQAGGPGGLRGSYQVEMLKAQGKFEEIQAMADKAMRKQFGGRVVTMEEAAKDEGAARQYTKQVQMLTQGPLKMVEGEGQARALIEAMAKGDTSGTAKIISGQESLEKAIDTGTKQTEKQSNILNTISANAQKMAVSTAISAAADSANLRALLNDKAKSGPLKDVMEKLGISEIFSSEEASKKAAQSKVGTLSARTPWEEFTDFISGKKLEKTQKEQAEKQKEAAPNAEQIIGKGLISEGFSAIGNLFSAPEIPSAPPAPPENSILTSLMNVAKANLGTAAPGANGTAQAPTEVNVNLKSPEGTILATVGMLIEGKVKEVFQSKDQQKGIGFP